ncbi:D-2-hydroxyacid dehydrogenase family protein [Myxococcus sp. K15C18031901]|uniref:D-2-hydroxyacid dehydrogenase family protein n=1 Tax=Myxococcus dinghuensis TaxID=2906761 RepID=UPI0020A71B05|nr:D-2-hydroxyacid dehydrogenase family protein [Myxococcus dinghuensis]MCP3101512.1 D-2-hydroxyacid dehydrogenase family protein [Myxococcus dinghuensis]
MKVAVLDDYLGVARDCADWSRLPPGATLHVFREPLTGEDAQAAALAGFDVVVAMRERTAFPATLLARLPDLRLLVTTGMRNAAIDLDACRRQGVTVCGTGAVGAPAAELTWALILALLKRVPEEDRALREGRWQTGLTRTVEGLRLGVVGLGKLGTQVARVGRAFGMDVVAWSPRLTAERAEAGGARLVDKPTLFSSADVVTLHLVLGEGTRGVVGAAELGAMKRSAYLVNTSRAGLVDEEALLSALREERIAGAGLDVFSSEPLPVGHPLTTLPNTVLTPHLGYATRENFAVYYREALEDILAWSGGQPVRALGAR